MAEMKKLSLGSMIDGAVRAASVSPEIVARSIFIGTVIALTPTFGIQMPLIGAVWLLLRQFERTRFNLGVGIAMSWLMNHFTFLPYYFVSYVTGASILRLFPGFTVPLGFAEFRELWSPLLALSFPESVYYLAGILGRLGVPLLIGTIPFMIVVPPMLTMIYSGAFRRRGVKPDAGGCAGFPVTETESPV